MEKQGLFSYGGMKLPIGFRFRPTDEELLVHYLKRKALSLPLPASVIPDFNVFHSDPWVVPGDPSEKRHFFCKMKCSKIIPTSSGYWSFIGKGKQILDSGRNQIVGNRESLAFYQGQYPNGCRTRWAMHEYRLLDSSSTRNPNGEIEDWVACLIFQRKRKHGYHGIITSDGKKDCNLGTDRPSYIDYKTEESFDLAPLQPDSPPHDFVQLIDDDYLVL
ncbi:hypothetical protein Nepgr_016892 [Nepenthes gracilis]|uniref:NAC domain-containing protein n=1 Tax=Nepenthes gracilis TaxID=150966 RepID=A0AAD3SRH4_NEPGR|nr:hypothetical protein Nepgr_016892 [Nepenthes gracilis]